jgi:putative transposase
VAGRDRAVSAAGRPLPEPEPQPPPPWDDADDGEDAGQLAEVIPLGIFDAREEARKWW